MAIALYMVLTLSAMNDVIAYKFEISLNATTWIGRIGMVVLPPIVYFFTYRWCIALQRSDRAVLEHGIETGIIKRLPHGAYIELHQPLGPVDEHGHPVPLEYQGAPVPVKMNKLGSSGSPGSGSFLYADPPAEDAATARALTALRDRQSATTASPSTPLAEVSALGQRTFRTWFQLLRPRVSKQRSSYHRCEKPRQRAHNQ
jgi:ubiquinol-cytochrome c reductase cytochrome b subunit